MRWCRERRRILTPARCGRGLRPAPAWLGGAKGGVELIPVRVAEDEHVDVSHWTQVGVPGGPGSVEVGRGDPADVPQDFGLTAGTPNALVSTTARPTLSGRAVYHYLK